MSFLGMLPNKVNVLRATKTSDGAGGFTETWPIQVSNLRCRLQQRSGDYRREVAGVEENITHMMFCVANADIRIRDRVESGSEKYLVLMRMPVSGHWQTNHLEIDLRRIEG